MDGFREEDGECVALVGGTIHTSGIDTTLTRLEWAACVEGT